MADDGAIPTAWQATATANSDSSVEKPISIQDLPLFSNLTAESIPEPLQGVMDRLHLNAEQLWFLMYAQVN